MANPILFPRPSRPAAPIARRPQEVLTHSDAEWAALYLELERLYVSERRKLRYIMQCMESRHGFKATEQMYKKRFAKWGFQKNAKRLGGAGGSPKTKDQQCKRLSRRKTSPPGELGTIPASPGLGQHDRVTLMVLTSVRTWTAAFFESWHFRDEFQAPPQKLPPTGWVPQSKAKEANFAFKLAIDLLERGHGDLAGRVARKAFLLAEDMLTLEGPVLLWNLLEMMYHMLTLHHAQLFKMLLAHLTGLADRQMPKAHPLPAMLRGMRALTASLTMTPTNPSIYSSPSSFLKTTSSRSDQIKIEADPWLLSLALPALLERAWILNAEILFGHLDPRLLYLYCGVVCESCSIAPPTAIVATANQWFVHIEAEQPVGAARVGDEVEVVLASTPLDIDSLTEGRSSLQMDVSQPHYYEMLRASSLTALRQRWNSIICKEFNCNDDTTLMLPLLAGLITAEVLGISPFSCQWRDDPKWVTTDVSPSDAGLIACAIRTLVDLKTKHGGEIGASLDVVEWTRAIVALRAYAEGEVDPRVVLEMWMLHGALVSGGKLEEAQDVERDACLRMEKYVQDIPVNSA